MNGDNNGENSISSNLGLFVFRRGFGRMGNLSGLFTADRELVKSCFGKSAYFGEVLGKHSDIDIILHPNDFHEIENFSQEELRVLGSKICGVKDDCSPCTLSGYNPINYIVADDDEGEDC